MLVFVVVVRVILIGPVECLAQVRFRLRIGLLLLLLTLTLKMEFVVFVAVR